VEIRGELELADAEWLHTNGAGAYSMSTLALMHTRRFHGLLVAALDPPLERHVVVSHAETCLEVGRRIYNLSTHQFPDIAPTPGFRLLETFSQDPLPRWVYRLGKHRLERKLCLARGRNMVIACYTWFGKTPARFTMKPLLSMRPIHDLRSEHGGIMQKVSLRRGEVAVQPDKDLPRVVFGHPGIFMGSPDWWRRFEYPEDMRRHVHYQEDLWTPGHFEITLMPGEPAYVTAAVGVLPEQSAAELMAQTTQELLALDLGPARPLAVRALAVAAEQFRVPACERPASLAGYPWLGVRTRDTLVSLPGLYLVQGLFEEAKGVLRTTVALRMDGLLASHVPEASSPVVHPTVDGSLWLFEAVRLLLQFSPEAADFVHSEMYPYLVDIFERVSRSPGELVWLTADGLVTSHSDTEPVTWMDSRAKGEAVTPRHGLAVELQALWVGACGTLESLARRQGDAALAERADNAQRRANEAFRRRFWCGAVSYAYDCIDDESGAADASIRPNALLALAIAPSLFEGWQARAIVTAARERLLTPKGIRTLDPAHPRYVGYYEGGMDERRAAYHQGVVWGYLVGALARASLKAFPDDFELQMDIRDWVLRAIENGPVLGQVAQVATGDAPHQAGGCPAQAWSVAEALRTLVDDLKL
jgi:predicted glycogen debranching enzyme